MAFTDVRKDTTLVKALERLAEEDPDREAFAFVDKYDSRVSLSRKYVWDKSRKFAAILKRQGIEKGEVVCNTLVNSPQRLIGIFGTITAGAISMGGDMHLANGEDLFCILRSAQCKAIILNEDDNIITSLFDKISYKDENDVKVRYKNLPYLKTLIKLKLCGEKNEDLSSIWLDEEQEIFEEEDICPDDICLIFHTSGTTGYSKAVPQTHRRMLLESTMFCEKWNAVNGDILYTDRSLSWMGGYPHFYMPLGNKIVLTNHAYRAPDDMPFHVIKIFETERCTHAILSGIEMERIMNKLTNPLPRLLKSLIPIGGHLVTSIRKAVGVLSHTVCVSYGGSEFGLVSSFTFGKDDYVEDFFAGSLRDGVEIKILNDRLEIVETGKLGEIFVRSPAIAGEYFNNPEKTEEAFFEDGWFKTKDLGFENDKGQLYVLGRRANVVKKGTDVFYTAWLEARFLKYPGIKDLALIGVPDPLYYEDFCLCIVPTSDGKLTKDSVLEFCKKLLRNGDNDGSYLVPKHILFFDEFPHNKNMKVDRVSLKIQACQRLDIQL